VYTTANEQMKPTLAALALCSAMACPTYPKDVKRPHSIAGQSSARGVRKRNGERARVASEKRRLDATAGEIVSHMTFPAGKLAPLLMRGLDRRTRIRATPLTTRVRATAWILQRRANQQRSSRPPKVDWGALPAVDSVEVAEHVRLLNRHAHVTRANHIRRDRRSEAVSGFDRALLRNLQDDDRRSGSGGMQRTPPVRSTSALKRDRLGELQQ
jgi:hypothetical protein